MPNASELLPVLQQRVMLIDLLRDLHWLLDRDDTIETPFRQRLKQQPLPSATHKTAVWRPCPKSGIPQWLKHLLNQRVVRYLVRDR